MEGCTIILKWKTQYCKDVIYSPTQLRIKHIPSNLELSGLAIEANSSCLKQKEDLLEVSRRLTKLLESWGSRF
jgi:hypothetical protein